VDLSQFYLGSISPDSISIRSDIRLRDKAKSHLCLTLNSLSGDHKAWIGHVVAFLEGYRGSEQFSFYLGYCIHILTDIYWYKTVFKRFMIRYRSDRSPVHSEKAAFGNDVEQLDRMLYQNCIWSRECIGILQKSECPALADLVCTDEVNEWKKRMLMKLDADETFKAPPRYLSIDDLLFFIEDTGNFVRHCLSREPGLAI
jgi:hypothetical protein